MRRVGIGVIAIALFVLSTIVVLADPTGPTGITAANSSRYGLTTGGGLVNAYAGNVTQLNINASAITQTWQGYYGNITGRVVLGNVNNKTLYDWNITTTAGQIYASRNSTISWTTVNCTNAGNMTAEDTRLGSTGKIDAVIGTFNQKAHNQFYVGSFSIASNQCNSTNLRDSNGYSTNWQEVLLSDNTNSIIYTSLISGRTLGFDSSNWDFEMLVGENGHSGDTSTTPYYFWVELV